MQLSLSSSLSSSSTLLALLLVAAMSCLSHGYVRPLHMSQQQSHQSHQRSTPSTSLGMDRRDLLSKGIVGGAAAAFASTFTLTTAPPKVRADVPAEGIEAPDFTLPSSLGKSLSLADLVKTKKYTVLYFFPQVFTSSCTLEAKAFQRDIDSYNKLNAQIVGVSVDESTKQTDFKSECGLDFILLSDKGAKVSEAYGSALDIPFLGRFSNRQTYIISPEGKLVKVFTNVESKVKRHSEEVLEALKALQA